MAVTKNYCHTKSYLNMKLIIKYSFFKELKEAINVLTHLDEYNYLRSFILPTPVSIFSFLINKNIAIKHTAKLWSKFEVDVQKAFKELNLKDPDTMPCYLHGMSCQGWFDTDDNSIHVRFPNNGGDKEFLDTIIHEILHLATYDDKYDYDQREEMVDKILAKPQFKKILAS
jgi:hypothetical protein